MKWQTATWPFSTVTRGDTYGDGELGACIEQFHGAGTPEDRRCRHLSTMLPPPQRGVPTAVEVSASLDNGVRVRFLPEVEAMVAVK